MICCDQVAVCFSKRMVPPLCLSRTAPSLTMLLLAIPVWSIIRIFSHFILAEHGLFIYSSQKGNNQGGGAFVRTDGVNSTVSFVGCTMMENMAGYGMVMRLALPRSACFWLSIIPVTVVFLAQEEECTCMQVVTIVPFWSRIAWRSVTLRFGVSASFDIRTEYITGIMMDMLSLLQPMEVGCMLSRVVFATRYLSSTAPPTTAPRKAVRIIPVFSKLSRECTRSH